MRAKGAADWAGCQTQPGALSRSAARRPSRTQAENVLDVAACASWIAVARSGCVGPASRLGVKFYSRLARLGCAIGTAGTPQRQMKVAPQMSPASCPANVHRALVGANAEAPRFHTLPIEMH